jgi:DNA-directed RNA polymerase specialized sigma24 family protein
MSPVQPLASRRVLVHERRRDLEGVTDAVGSTEPVLPKVFRAMPLACSPVTALAGADQFERLSQSFGRLPAHQRVPLVLFHFDAMSYEAIAARLRVPVSRVRADCERGRDALLRNLVGACAPD